VSTATTHDDPLAARLREVLCAAHRRWREHIPMGTALLVPAIPTALLDQVAAGLAPVLREMVDHAVAARDAADLAVVAETATGGPTS
jgi:hypothetical protein